MFKINCAVGADSKRHSANWNQPFDVRIIQHLLNEHLTKEILKTNRFKIPLLVDGLCGNNTIAAIEYFQIEKVKLFQHDSIVNPNGPTFKKLTDGIPEIKLIQIWNDAAAHGLAVNNSHAKQIAHVANKAGHRIKAPYVGANEVNSQILRNTEISKPHLKGATTPTNQDYLDAAAKLDQKVEVNIIRAFATVESGGKSGFNDLNLPVIAFEGHIFRKYSGHKFDKTHPLLSYPYKIKAGPQWKSNNRNQIAAWNTLSAAYDLDAKSALLACSWGMFQVMGFNYSACGFQDVFQFVDSMKSSAGRHLAAFVNFAQHNPALLKALQNKNFQAMAINYNGSDYGDYDHRISAAYELLKGKK